VNRKAKLVILCAALALAAAACDFQPSTAFDGFDGEASSGVLDTQGATLRGTFQGSGARGLRAQRALTVSSTDELTVYVFEPEDFASLDFSNVDTDLAIGSAPIVGGRFTLRGLPDDFYLVFVDDTTGEGVGDMEFDGVRPNQELDILVALSEEGDDVVLLDEKRTGIDHDDLEFVGSAEIVEIGDNPMDGGLYVNEYYVESRAGQTSIRKGNRSLTLDDIPDGAQVKVRGILEDEMVDGRPLVFAQEIKLQDEEDEDGDGDKITICHIPPGNPDNAKTISISSSAWPAHERHGDTMGACNGG